MSNAEKKILNKTSYIAILLFLIIALSGCNKDIEFTFSGNILDKNGTPITNAKVEVWEDAGTIQSTYKLVESSTTDGSGYYTITIPRKQVNSYKVQLNSNIHHVVNKEIGFDDVNSEEDNIVNLTSHTRSWVQFNIVNNDPDKDISLLKISGNENCPDCCPDGYSFYYGVTNTVKICGADAGEYYKFGVQIPGISYEVDSVLCPEYDTVVYTITP